jgi:hypothetical protein
MAKFLFSKRSVERIIGLYKENSSAFFPSLTKICPLIPNYNTGNFCCMGKTNRLCKVHRLGRYEYLTGFWRGLNSVLTSGRKWSWPLDQLAGIDGHVHLIRLIRLQTDNNHLFLLQQTDKLQTFVCTMCEMVNGKGKMSGNPFSVFCLKRQSVYVYVYNIYCIVPFSVHIYKENGTNGKWKRQTSICLLQMDTENVLFFFLVGKR